MNNRFYQILIKCDLILIEIKDIDNR